MLKSKFVSFAKFGDKAADGSTIKLSQSDKWFKQAGVISAKGGVSTTDTGIAFKKISKSVKYYQDFYYYESILFPSKYSTSVRIFSVWSSIKVLISEMLPN